ncbi:MAG: glycosyl hydrolase [Spirochaetales bacterium]|nr:glycosyl hydrolase [Spirochaetales bacterium]
MPDLRGKPFNLSEEEESWVRNTLKNMSREEKIGQLFCLIQRSDDKWRQEADAILKYRPGGIMFRPMESEKVWMLSRYYQDNSDIPMFLAANLERGGAGLVSDGTNYASNMQVAATDDEAYALTQAAICAREAKAVGGNWSFAPVIDLDYNFRNPITNTRTYGSDPERVARMGRAYTKTIQEQGLAASIKHFPGDGVDERDQHLVTSVNMMECAEWEETYGRVYQASIDEGALTVMAGHIMLPSWSKKLNPELHDRDILPATLSPEILNGLLRERLGFNGMIVSDATTMVGMQIPMSREKAVPRVIAAGCDMFLFTRSFEEDYAYMARGVEEGVITPERLDEAVTRILATKAALKLPVKKEKGNLIPSAKGLSVIGCKEHKELARKCADEAITLVKSDGTLPLDPAKKKRVLLYLLGDMAGYGNLTGGMSGYFREKMEAEGFDITLFVPKEGMEGLMSPYKEVVNSYDLILYFSALATKSNQTTVRIEWSFPMGANCPLYIASIPTIFISMENPYHLLDVPRIKTFINCYTNSREVVDSLIEKLMGRDDFRGKSPVDPFCGRWDTRL